MTDSKFGELKVHKRAPHPTFPHTFNPYGNSRWPTHRMDDRQFRAILDAYPMSCELALAHLFTGLIDAPDDIPMGATERISTCGGFEREEYMNLPRGTEDWKVRAKASAEVAEMIKKILKEIDE